MSLIHSLVSAIRPARFLVLRCLPVAAAAMLAFAAPPAARAAAIDGTYGGGHGYVPVAALETDSDSFVAAVRDSKDTFIAMGRRLVLGRGVAVLQRYKTDGTLDDTFGDKGLATVDIPGVSLTPRDLLIQPSGRLIVVAESTGFLRMIGLLANGQPDSSYGIGGEQDVPLNAGIPAGSVSVQLLRAQNNADGQIVIMPNTPGASFGVTMYRYSIDGKTDPDFGNKGKQVLSNVAPGLAFTGVSAATPDARYILVAAATSASDPTRMLIALTKDGVLDTLGFGTNGTVTPATLQGRDIRVITPLANNFFVLGSNTSTLATINRFDSAGRLDATFGTSGTLRVEPQGGGLVLINDIFEQLDNNLFVTGTTGNSMFVARYLQRGTIDPNFNGGKGPQLIADPSAALSNGVMSINYDGSQTLTFGNAIAFGADPASATAPSRAIVVSTIDGAIDTTLALGKGILQLYGRKAPFGEFVNQVLPLPDGRIMVLSGSSAENGLAAALARYLPDGSLDRTFGANGRTTFRQNGQCEWPMSMALQPDGKVVVLGTSFDTLDCDKGAMFGKRFDTNGNIENWAIFYGSSAARARSAGIAIQADGKSVITGQDDRAFVVARFLSTGAVDPSFGANGRLLWVRSANDLAKGGAVLVQADQKIVAGGSMNGTQLVLLRTTTDGNLDPSFGTGGVTLVDVASTSFLEVQALKQTPAGKFMMLARIGQRPILAQFNANGSLDTSFGSNGLVTLPLFVGGTQYARFGLAVQSDGGLVVSGQTTDNPSSSMALMRLSSNGQVDTQFGPNGLLTYRPSVYFAAGANAIASLDNGTLYVGGYGLPGSLLFRIGNPIVAGTVVEFYNTTLNHYFITADAPEAAAIDAGSAGPGWSRTGAGFRVYTSALGVPSNAIPVCRFYGSTAIDPATGQRRGPNSHFYTAIAAECAAVKNDPGWTYESIAFYTIAPQGDGSCAAGLIPVYRVYNNRFAQNDSNHRYTTDLSVYQLMQSSGWKPEGIVFCTPAG